MIALTGATGFFGSHIASALHDRGSSFVCLVRHFSPRISRVCDYKQEAVDFASVESLTHALTGVSTVIHVVGLINGSDDALELINVTYTKNLLEASRAAGVKKFIFISSVAATMKHGPYGRSKAKAEEAVFASGIPYTIFRPAFIYGKGDEHNTGMMLRTLKRFPVVPLLGGGHFKLQPVYVENAVELILQAVDRPAVMKGFAVAGPAQISLKEILEILCETNHLKRAFLPIPLRPAQFLARIYAALFPKTKLPVKQVMELDKHEAFDISETAKVFGFQPIPFREGAKRMMEDSKSCAA